jgi:hypothetical protein
MLLLLFLSPPAFASRTEPKEFDFGFIASRHKDVHGDWRLKAAGPLFEGASSTQDMHFLAVRPLYSIVTDPPRDRAAEDFLWPLATRHSVENQSRWRCLIFFGYNHDTASAKPRHRLWLFPFYFQGRDARGVNYRAVFPLGGSIHEFLGRDEINFVLFPARSTSKLNDLETSNWLWPIYAETKGEDTYRWRMFPFYAVSRRDGEYEKKFILWPFWNQVRYDYSNSAGSGYVLFPLMGHMKLTDQETWWVLPPFIRFTKGETLDQVFCPWPFFQYARSRDPGALEHPLVERARSAGYEKLYFWPIWGHKRVGNLDQSFYLWPLIWRQEIDRVGQTKNRFVVVPFFQAESDEKPSGEIVGRYNKFWPLYSYRRQGDESRFRVLELWPFAEAPAVERNWAPFWTLYSRTGAGVHRDSELLWGLYRNQKRGSWSRYVSLFPLVEWKRDDYSGNLRRWALLKGLVGYESRDSRKRVRLLYFLHIDVGQDPQP